MENIFGSLVTSDHWWYRWSKVKIGALSFSLPLVCEIALTIQLRNIV